MSDTEPMQKEGDYGMHDNSKRPAEATPARPCSPGPKAAIYVILVACVAAAGPLAQETDCVGFEERSIMAGGTNGASSVFAADLDGDGDIDVISGSSNDDTVAWYRNDGAMPPNFDRKVIATDADGVASVYAADVDGDGDVDVLAASANDNRITLYENITSGQAVAFVPSVIASTANRAQSVFAANVDFDPANQVDPDMDLDILSASFTDNTIAWYENPREDGPLSPDGGSFGFNRRIVTTGAINASAVYAADLDGDGDVDVLSASVADDKIAWYENKLAAEDDNGNLFLEFTEHVITTEADGARSVFATDIDGDGRIDVLSASISDDTVAWYRNEVVLDATPPTTFTRQVISTEVAGAKSVFAADLNGDGRQDVLVAAARANTVYWFENQAPEEPEGLPTFLQHTVSTPLPSTDAVYAIDLDGVVGIDVLSASSVPGAVSNNDKVAWHQNDGQVVPTFTEYEIASTAEGLNSLFLADIDGVAGDELVAATTNDRIVWYAISLGGDPVFERDEIAGPLDQVSNARSVFVYDLDDDGDRDVISASAGNDRIYLHVNSLNGGAGPPGFEPPVMIASGAASVESVFVADMDADGIADVVAALPGRDSVSWYKNPCTGAGACPDPLPEFVENPIASNDSDIVPFSAIGARSVYAAKVDDDDLIDVLVASPGEDKISLFLNQSEAPGTFVEVILASSNLSESVFSEVGAFSVSATDIDQDGLIDVLVAASGDGRISWYEQEDDFTFIQHNVNVIAPVAAFVGFADVDGDGDDDILATSLGDNRVLWHENRLDERTDPEDDVVFTRHVVNRDGVNPVSVVATDVDEDTDTDLLVGFRFRSSWFEQTGESCVDFDVNGDMMMNGVELAYVGRAFGMACDTPPATGAEWICGVDYNRDGIVDGLDLAILSSPGVWGQSTAVLDGAADCSYTCR